MMKAEYRFAAQIRDEHVDLGQFKLASDEAFDSFARVVPEDNSPQYNFCPDCNRPMNIRELEYQCPDCARIIPIAADLCKDHDETRSGNIKISTGAYKGKFYNINHDYSKTQKKLISDQLIHNNSAFVGRKFPRDILMLVALGYNNIQKLIFEVEEADCRSQKKFVRRGNMKDEIIASLLYYECIRAGITRKKKDIAAFMNLPTSGFSRGEDVLRSLNAEGRIDIPVDIEPADDFVDRYLEALNIEDAPSREFVRELVAISEEKKIGMNLQISSKIVGAIWVLIQNKGLDISSGALEKAADDMKKNTFLKFHKLVHENMSIFGAVFDKFSIPRTT